MRRAILEKLMAARREDRLLVRALNLANGEERLLDPACVSSPLGRAAAMAAGEGVSRRITLEGHSWFLTVYQLP
ncbi:MAG TPA: hypothetical protein VEM35_07740, partial [Rhizomicrobium sp.]|nr:hypothetical protein [Rhizomicrobium sp.]